MLTSTGSAGLQALPTMISRISVTGYSTSKWFLLDRCNWTPHFTGRSQAASRPAAPQAGHPKFLRSKVQDCEWLGGGGLSTTMIDYSLADDGSPEALVFREFAEAHSGAEMSALCLMLEVPGPAGFSWISTDNPSIVNFCSNIEA
jgi:hypothetical protein